MNAWKAFPSFDTSVFPWQGGSRNLGNKVTEKVIKREKDNIVKQNRHTIDANHYIYIRKSSIDILK